MARLGLLGTRLWWRRGSSLAVLAVALTATLTAVVGPMYAGAAAESTLRSVLSSAPVDESGLHVQIQGDVTVDPLAPIERILPAGFSPAYPVAIPTLRVPTRVQGPGAVPPVLSNVVWRPGTCSHVRLLAGHCPRGASDVMISARTAVPTWAMHVGVRIAVPGLPQDQVTGESGGVPLPAPGVLQVVGVYTPLDLDDPFWFGHDYFAAHAGSGPTGEGPDVVDDMFADRPVIDGASAGTLGLAWLDYPLAPTAVTLGTVGALRRAVTGAQRTFPPTEQPTLTTRLGAVLDRAHEARSGLDSGTALVTVQLLLLAWLVLFQVVSASAESRGPEIAIAKLRGLRPWDATAFGLGEPVALVAAAAPLGILAGYVAARGLAAAVLVDGVPVHVGLGTWLAAATALAGGLVATALASRRTLSRPVLEQWRRAEEHVSRGRRALVLDVAATALAVAGLLTLAGRGALGSHPSDSRPSVLSLVGPALLVLATALVGVRLLPVLGRVGADLSRGTRHVGLFLAVRQVARRATEHRFAVLLAVASGVAVFSVAANDVVRHNESRRAQAEVGANAVVNVQPQAGVDVMAAVAKVDPRGTWAMAADAWSPVGGSVGVTIQTVDVARLSMVGHLDSTPLRALLPALTTHAARSVMVTGSAVRVTTTATGRFERPTLDVTVVDARGRTTVVRGPAIRSGPQTVVVDVPCVDGCRLVGLALNRNVLDLATMTGTWTVTAIEERTRTGWATLAAQLAAPHAWRPGPTQTSGRDDLTVGGAGGGGGGGAGGVTDTFTAEPGGWPSLELADEPRPLPVILTANATVTPDGPAYVNDPVGRQVALQRVATVARLPRLLASGGLADVAAARDALPAFDRYGHWQVWLGAAAPADALDRLRAAGLVPGRPDTVARHLQALRQQGPALALQLFLFASFACSALALAAAALALAAAGRRRSFEMAALLAVGVRRGSLLRACVVEQLLLLGTGLVLGVVPGLVGAAIALPSVPEYADTSPVPLLYSPSTAVVVAFVAALTVVVAAVAVVGGAALLRAAVPARLREAAP